MKIYIVVLDSGSIGGYIIIGAYTTLVGAEKCIQENYPDWKEVGCFTFRNGNEYVTIHTQELE
ncbi:hypothetical protein UFOVP1290_176 [uncultured Caudovirales phage]|uniref:Uncharacterized protein n=1 Tax=uncultured Caudovirales phage TaxID=2100421 RepID=A0A6J5RQT9_9CAUD|nr:hypothetical protein UFOVP1290_176 [uncultured Caudovirales phage]